MNFKIEGNSISFEAEAERDGIKVSALVRLDGGEWRITRTYGTTWLAQGRVGIGEVLNRTMMILSTDLGQEQIRRRDRPDAKPQDHPPVYAEPAGARNNLPDAVVDTFNCRYCGPGKRCAHYPMCEGAP
jgi:hypothetical protein